MKLIKGLIITLVILLIIGFGVYHFGTKIASDKMVKTLSTELENSGEIEEIEKAIENDPDIKAFVEDAKAFDTKKLPFTTKEEATKVLVKKIGISELNDMRVKLQDGSLSKREVFEKVQGKLTDEELQALKVIAYKELSK